MNHAKDDTKAIPFPPTPPRSERGASPDAQSKPDFPLPPLIPPPTEVLDIDKNTPDSHVPRDPRLIRLTGVHPFNVEPPLTTLFDHGFITPQHLFYVRNHGAVPEVSDAEVDGWTITITGLVENPITVTVRELREDYPQNQLRKSNGFSWGSAGASTGLFTGVLLSDVIARVRPLKNARHLCMEGADNLPNGPYGTSIRLRDATNPDYGVLLAHSMNGAQLHGDHGHPIRVVVPGEIGGRSVKWLRRIEITRSPSRNWYHRFDNRVLPTMITPLMAAAPNAECWDDENTALHSLSVNSVIAKPEHGECVVLKTAAAGYRVQGYAYSGGMRRVVRVEVSVDKGRSWRLAGVEYPEDRYRQLPETTLFGGRLTMADTESVFSWCFWSLEVPIVELASADDLIVRAVDDAMNVQPRDMYWSVLGMMHNAWFRVAIRKERGGEVLRFEHPTQPASMPGGWMERVKKEGGDLTDGNWGEKVDGMERAVEAPVASVQIKMVNDQVKRIIEIDELRKHESAEAPWFVVDGEVYDGTEFLKEHPGGAQSIISAAGLDATDEFMGIHSEAAKAMMPKYHIGSLSEASRVALAGTQEPDDTSAPREFFLDARAWKRADLIAKKSVSWDTRIFTFKLEHSTQALGLPVGQHLMLRIQDPKTDETIVRPYTPISKDQKNGVVELLVKVYLDSATTKGGRMTMALDSLPLGQSATFKGPIGKLTYLGRGRVSVSGSERTVTSFCMICAGSGITPILQILRAIVEDRNDRTQCVLLDGNRQEEDILCRDLLDTYAAENADRLKLVHTLTKPTAAWTGRTGRVDAELIRSVKPEGGNTMFLVCGPESMEKSVRGILEGMGYDDGAVVFF